MGNARSDRKLSGEDAEDSPSLPIVHARTVIPLTLITLTPQQGNFRPYL